MSNCAQHGNYQSSKTLGYNSVLHNARIMERESRRMIGEQEWARISDVAAANADKAVDRVRRYEAKVTLEQAAEMRAKRAQGATLRELADEYGVGTRYVCNVCKGKKRVDHGR